MIRLSKPLIGDEELKAIKRVLDSGHLGMGPEVQAFENELAEYFGADRKVVCVNTGTASLHLAVQALGLKSGDELLAPSITYVATYQAISATGATPIACDVQEKDALLDLNDAAKRITPRTKAIMPVHYASYMGDLSAVYAFAQERGLKLIEDAAQAFGCEYQGKKIGSFGDVVCFSFDAIKNITCGEGGIIVSSDPTLLAKIQDARLLGVEKDTEKRYQGLRSWEFDVTEQGWRYHMSDIMAAIGRVQLQRFSTFRSPRIELAQYYRKSLAELPHVKLLETNLGPVVPHIQPIRILNGKRDKVREALLQEGIQVGIHYKPNHLLSRYGGGKVSLPISEKLYGELLTLPLHLDLANEEIDRVVKIIARTVELS